jgi:hypothetical protein
VSASLYLFFFFAPADSVFILSSFGASCLGQAKHHPASLCHYSILLRFHSLVTMYGGKLVVVLLGLCAIADASVLRGSRDILDRRQTRGGRGGGRGGNNNNNNNNNNAGQQDPAATTCLVAEAVQTGSASNGQEDGAQEGQVPSQVSTNNFLNFCAGKQLTNGQQITTGSCNGIGKALFNPKTRRMPL